MRTQSKTQLIVIGLVSSWLIIFGVLPILLLVGTSFLTQDPINFFHLSPSLKAYTQIFSPNYLSVMLRSVKYALATTFLCLVIGYPFAWYTARLKKNHRTIVLVLLMIPFWTNSLIRTYAIRMILGTQGILNKLLIGLGLIDAPLRLMYTDSAVILGLFYLMLPFMILPLYANVEKLDYRLIEAARDLGARFTHIFRKIIWPLTLPGVYAGCIMVFVPTMGLFYVATLLGGSKQLLVGNLIQQQFLNARNWPLGSATSIVLIIMMALMLAGYALVLRRLAMRRQDQ